MPPPRKRKRTLLKLATLISVLLVVAYLGISAYIVGTILHPVRKPLTTTPAQYGLSYQAVAFKSTDGILLKGWLMDSSTASNGQKRGTIMLLHGSSSNKGNYIMMEVARALCEHGFRVFSFDFRGNGESGGDLNSLGQWETRDVAGALQYLKTQGIEEVGVIGYSMGAATALLAAPNHPEMRAIVSDSAFALLSTVIEQEGMKTSPLAPFFNPGVALMGNLLYGLDISQNRPERAIATLGNRPLLLIHSTDDNLIPVSEAYQLQRVGASNPNLELWVAQGAGHVSAFADNREEYLRRVIEFFDKWLGAGR